MNEFGFLSITLKRRGMIWALYTLLCVFIAGVLSYSVIGPEFNPDYLIKNALGLRQNLKIKKSSSFVRLKFLKFKSGKIKKINHDIRVKNLLNFRINLKPGNTISPAKSGDKRHGFVIFFEKNLKKLDQSQKKILKKIKIIYGK